MEVIMPKMGESVSEGTIIKWHKKIGEGVKRDEIIFEISTDKVDTEIPSPADGILKEIKVNEGDTVEVGTVVAVISENGDAAVTKTVPEQKETETKTTTSSANIIDIALPKMGESVMEGTIIKWHKKIGEGVKRDEIIFEISTDKVDTEIPSPADGILKEIKVNEGDTVEVGTVVAVISENGDAAVTKTVPEQKETETKTTTSSANIIDIALPKMGESVMEGTIIKWHKKVGEKVKKDEPIFEISTDKVDTEVPSPEDGTIVEILVAEQETVEVGTIVAKLSTGKDDVVKKTERKTVSTTASYQPASTTPALYS